MSAVENNVPALDLEAVQAPLERKASFTKKVSKKIKVRRAAARAAPAPG